MCSVFTDLVCELRYGPIEVGPPPAKICVCDLDLPYVAKNQTCNYNPDLVDQLKAAIDQGPTLSTTRSPLLDKELTLLLEITLFRL